MPTTFKSMADSILQNTSVKIPPVTESSAESVTNVTNCLFLLLLFFLISQGNNNWWEIHILIHQQYEMWPTQYQPRSRNISAWQSRRRNCSILPIAVNYSGRRRRSVLITKKGWQSQRCSERENKASSSSSSSSCCGLVLMKTHWLLPNLPEYVVTVGGTIFQ